MSKLKDLTKRKFGRLTVIKRVENNKYGRAVWECRCKCNKITTVQGGYLLSGATRSCGCLQKEKVIKLKTTHGMWGTREYITWGSMVQRCRNPKDTDYQNYGARGITVCDKWLRFAGFFEDMGFKPKGLTLERKNNDIGYNKENCSWATYSQQNKNQRIMKTNKTGITGVFWLKRRKKYRAEISANHKKHPLGYFKTLEEAAKARALGEQKYWK